MPVFITESGYVDVKKIRPKVGTGSPETPTLVLLDLARHTQVTLDLSTLPGLADDPLAELRRAAEAAKSAAARAAESDTATAAKSTAQAASDAGTALAAPAPRPVSLADVAVERGREPGRPAVLLRRQQGPLAGGRLSRRSVLAAPHASPTSGTRATLPGSAGASPTSAG